MNSSLLTSEELEARRLTGDVSYSQRKQAAEARVVRWEWATGPLYSFEPFDAESGRWGRGRLCKTPPDDVSKKYAFGFDEEDALLIIRQHTEFQGCCFETIVDSDPQWIWRYDKSDKSVPARITQRIVDANRLVVSSSKTLYGASTTRYGWKDGRIRTIVKDGQPSSHIVNYRSGMVSAVTIVREGVEPHVVFTAKPINL